MEIILDSPGIWFKKFTFTFPTHLCLIQTKWDGFSPILICRIGTKLKIFAIGFDTPFHKIFLFCPLQKSISSLTRVYFIKNWRFRVDAEGNSAA